MGDLFNELCDIIFNEFFEIIAILKKTEPNPDFYNHDHLSVDVNYYLIFVKM